MSHSDPILDFVIRLAREHVKPRRVLLFGSRARGDFTERSDYDIAVDESGNSDTSWARFSLSVRDEAPTLKSIDLVRLSQVDENFRSRILSEGKVIYDSKAKPS